MEGFEGAIIGIIVGLVITTLVFYAFDDDPTNIRIQQLGQAICEQEHDLTYDKYEEGILYCKGTPTLQEYDGIQIQIQNEVTI